jgi:hypothetical protein
MEAFMIAAVVLSMGCTLPEGKQPGIRGTEHAPGTVTDTDADADTEHLCGYEHLSRTLPSRPSALCGLSPS